jgi:hypothetical protein
MTNSLAHMWYAAALLYAAIFKNTTMTLKKDCLYCTKVVWTELNSSPERSCLISNSMNNGITATMIITALATMSLHKKKKLSLTTTFKLYTALQVTNNKNGNGWIKTHTKKCSNN